MKLYFYCVIKDYERNVKPGRSIDDQQVYLINNKPLYAVVSTTNKFSFPESAPNIKMHESIIKKFMEKYPVLPFPFNTIVGEKIGKGVLYKYYDKLLKNLDEIGNDMEFGLWASKKVKKDIQRKEASMELGGLDSQKDLKTKILAAKINARFSNLSKQVDIMYLINEIIILESKYLVEKKHIADFKEEFRFCKKLYPELEFTLRGPIPPYFFNKVKITEDNVAY